jgi:hypothetical protein
MWHALRAELAYFRPWLLGAFGIAIAVAAIISVVFYFDDDPPGFVATGLRALFLVMGPMIVSFIIQSYRVEERRARLLLTGPLTPMQLAWVMVLIPWVLGMVGVLAAAVVIAADVMITGAFSFESLNMAGFVGGQMFTYAFMGLLAQEASAARQQQRRGAARTGWSIFVGSIFVIAASYVILARRAFTWGHVGLTHCVVALVSMVACIVLYGNRTDFTR